MDSKKINIPVVLSLALFLPLFIASNQFTDPFILPKYFYLYFFAAVFLSVFCIWNLSRKYTTKLTITWLDIAVLAYIFYQIMHAIFTPDVALSNDNLLTLIISGIFYFAIKPWLTCNDANKNTIHTLFTVLMFMCFVQASYGILQYLEVLSPLQEEFKLGGAYGNPGPYANSLVPFIPFALASVIYKRNKKGIFYLGLLALFASAIVLPLTKSRTSWIATLLAVLYLLYNYVTIKEFVNKWIARLWIRIVALILAGILLAGMAIFLFKYKEQSSSGRLFIWKVSLQMVADKPVFGFGFDKYAVAHNDYQADYFAAHPDAKEEGELADAVTYAFNEYIQIAGETGFIGLLLFLSLVFFSFFKGYKTEKTIESDDYFFIAAKGSLLTILVSGMFSYPLRTVPVIVILMFALSIISANFSVKVKEIKFTKQNRKLLSFAGIVLVVLFAVNQAKKYKASKEWIHAYKLARSREYQKAMTKYEELYPILNYNHYFLFNYGAELSVMGKYQQSVELLREAEPRLNDVDLYIYLGNSYVGLGDLENAAFCFKKASLIVPVKFYPRYRLVKIYLALNEQEQALELARDILGMKVKIPSDIITNIRNEMQELVNSYQSLNTP